MTIKPIAVPFPIWSTSIVIKTSSVIALSEITAGVAAVTEVVSLLSIVNLVDNIEVPDLLISTVKIFPDVWAVRSEALTCVSVNAVGLLKYAFVVPVVIAFTRSEHDNCTSKRINLEKLSAYECGLEPLGNARLQIKIVYYIIGILYLLFDLEIIFLYPLAAS